MPKKLKGGTLWSRPVLYLRGKPFWFSSLGQRVQFGGFLKFCRTFGVELFWSLQVHRKKFKIKRTLTKSHDYGRLFSLEKRRLKSADSLKFAQLWFKNPEKSRSAEKNSRLHHSLVQTKTSQNAEIEWGAFGFKAL